MKHNPREMGVRGLTSYIEKHSDQYLEPYELKDCSIVIDGNSLASQLYSSVSNCNCAFGGDYDKYASCVKYFFSLLKRCCVTSFVIFDGGYETRKLPTARARLKDKLSTAKIVTPAMQLKFRCFPLFMNEVFRDVLASMEIPFAQCDFEADGEIATIARRLGCPVLSYDSDFYVHDVLYIPFSTIVLQPEQHESVEDKDVKQHIDCQIYNRDKFLYCHGGLDKSLLPVVSALLGNDYIEHRVFGNFLSQIKLPRSSSVSRAQRQIMGLFKWLRKETVVTAVEKILHHIKGRQRQVVAKQLNEIIAGYSICSSSVLPYLVIPMEGNSKLGCSSVTAIAAAAANLKGKENCFYSVCDSDIKTSSGQISERKVEEENMGKPDEPLLCGTCMLPQNLFPHWFRDSLRCGKLPRCFINMLVHKIHFSAPQVEDFSLPFSHRISLPVLCVIFGLLTAGKIKCELELQYIVYKKNAQLHTIVVLPTYSTASVKEFPPLKNIPDLPIPLRRNLLYDVMGFDANDIVILKGFPDDWKIFIVALIYWGRNVSEPSLTIQHIHAILFSIISLNVVDRRAGYYRSKKIFLKQNGSKLKKIVILQNVKENEDKTGIDPFERGSRELSGMFENNLPCFQNSTVTEALTAVSSEECLCLVETMLSYHQMNEYLKNKPSLFSVSLVHMFAQFQSCLLHVMHLNALLNLPFIQCQIHNFYSGTFIYNAYVNFKKCSDVENYILIHLLKCAPSVAALYRVMVKSVTDFLTNLTATKTRKKKHKKKKNDSRCYNKSTLGNEENVSAKSQSDDIVRFTDHNRFSALSLGGSNQ